MSCLASCVSQIICPRLYPEVLRTKEKYNIDFCIEKMKTFSSWNLRIKNFFTFIGNIRIEGQARIQIQTKVAYFWLYPERERKLANNFNEFGVNPKSVIFFKYGVVDTVLCSLKLKSAACACLQWSISSLKWTAFGRVNKISWREFTNWYNLLSECQLGFSSSSKPMLILAQS